MIWLFFGYVWLFLGWVTAFHVLLIDKKSNDRVEYNENDDNSNCGNLTLHHEHGFIGMRQALKMCD